ncbi:MAG: hypothetical protein D6744_08475, partial [Planctomycetota bacterium]
QQHRGGSTYRCPSGWSQLDAALGGGFACGALHELIAADPTAATLTIALRVASHAAQFLSTIQCSSPPDQQSRASASQSMSTAAPPLSAARGSWLLLVDADGDFYPPAAARLGVPLSRLLLIRTGRRAAEIQWVCEQALRCGAIAAVIAPAAHLDAYASRRLQLAAETGGGLGLLLRNEPAHGHTFAASRLRVEPASSPGARPAVRIVVLKVREGRPASPFVIDLADDAERLRFRWEKQQRPAHAG